MSPRTSPRVLARAAATGPRREGDDRTPHGGDASRRPGNKMTEESAGGVVVVVCGVALYNWARVRFPVVVDEGEPTTPRPQTLLETVSPRQRFSPKDVV